MVPVWGKITHMVNFQKKVMWTFLKVDFPLDSDPSEELNGLQAFSIKLLDEDEQ